MAFGEIEVIDVRENVLENDERNSHRIGGKSDRNYRGTYYFLRI